LIFQWLLIRSRAAWLLISPGRVLSPSGGEAPAAAPEPATAAPPVVRGGGPPVHWGPGAAPASSVVGRGAAASVSIITPVPTPVSASVSSSASAPSAGGGPAHVHAGRGGVSPLGDGEVHTNLPAVHLSPIQSFFGLFGILHILEVDESEAAAAASVAVEDHLDLLERPKLLELGLELPLVGVEAQSEHADALAGRGIVSVALVTSSVGHRGPGVIPASSGVLPLTGPSS